MVLAATIFFGSSMHSAAAVANCVPVRGKITNNAIAADTTLGVVALEYGPKGSAIKLKCGLVGAAQPATPPAMHFVHTISCDDQLIAVPAFDKSGDVPVHSSIVLDTTGSMLPPKNALQLFSFTETSVPMLGVGARGLFYGVTAGQLFVEGVVYKGPVAGVPGSIDMTFAGQVCYAG